MTVRDDIVQGIREWLMAYSAASPLTDEQVVPAEFSGNRTALPYLTVRVLSYDIAVGVDELISGLDGSDDPELSVRGQREGTVTIQAFGDQATEWLTEAKLSLNVEGAQTLLHDAGLAVALLGNGAGNIAAVLADKTELRSTQDLRVNYTINSITRAGVELVTVNFEGTFEDNTPNDLVETTVFTV